MPDLRGAGFAGMGSDMGRVRRMGERMKGRSKSPLEVGFSQEGKRKERRLCANESAFSNEALFLEGHACFCI